MLIRADARAIPLVDGCVQCVVTSPPYWGLRDYGSAHQIGLEGTPAAYVANLMEVFREVWRVLKDDGTAWLNLGDSYCTSPRGNRPGDLSTSSLTNPYRQDRIVRGSKQETNNGSNFGGPNRMADYGAKHKDLIGIPWRVAFALQAEGWYLRSDIIWAKPNPMPESVTDRPTKAHEYLFLLTKSERYAYDAAAIAEPTHGRERFGNSRLLKHADRNDCERRDMAENWERNKRTVWTIPTMPYAGAHFATMPEALVEPCILAGCPLGGLVFDPFVGSGTVIAVATRLGRRAVGTDLAYQDLAATRTRQRGLAFVLNDSRELPEAVTAVAKGSEVL